MISANEARELSNKQLTFEEFVNRADKAIKKEAIGNKREVTIKIPRTITEAWRKDLFDILKESGYEIHPYSLRRTDGLTQYCRIFWNKECE